jgi:hypothetical protein
MFVLLVFLVTILEVSAFTTLPHRSHSLSRKAMIFDSSILIGVGDYAAEIEKAVGTEVYTPIFKAGIFLFLSGIISSFIAAFIISKSDSWEELNLEFERGKESKLITREMDTPVAALDASNVAVQVNSPDNVSQEIKDLDL